MKKATPNFAKATTGKYLDGFVIVVPKKNIAAYKKMARMGAKIWKKYGALDYKECVGEDLKPTMPDMPDMPGMQAGTFPGLTKIKPSETVVFSYITYKSRKHRDQVNAKVMQDPFMNTPQNKNQPMPFDMKRMYYGGFTVMVEG